MPQFWKQLGNHMTCGIQLNATQWSRKMLPNTWERTPCNCQSSKKMVSRSPGSQVYHVHRPLNPWELQHSANLSRCQLCWQEFMSQYEMKFVYIKGEDNCVADALSHLPKNCFQDEHPNTPAPHEHWKWLIDLHCTINQNQLVCASFNKGRIQIWSFLCSSGQKWYPWGSVHQWALVHWGLFGYSSHKGPPWKPVSSGTWLIRPFQSWQILHLPTQHLLLTQHADQSWKILCSFVQQLPKEQVKNNETPWTTPPIANPWQMWWQHRPWIHWPFPLQRTSPSWYLTIGTVKMVYHSTGSPTGISSSCCGYGKPLENSLAFNSRCHLLIIHRQMVLVKEPIKPSTNQSISMLSETKKDGYMLYPTYNYAWWTPSMPQWDILGSNSTWDAHPTWSLPLYPLLYLPNCTPQHPWLSLSYQE